MKTEDAVLHAVIDYLTTKHKTTVTRSDNFRSAKRMTFLNKRDGVSVRLVSYISKCINLVFYYRGRGSGYRNSYNNSFLQLDATQSESELRASIDSCYKYAKLRAVEFRMKLEQEEATPLVGYKCGSLMTAEMGDSICANVTIYSCRVRDVVAVRNRRAFRDVEDPKSGNPFFLAFCLDPSKKRFAIVTDGLVVHPVMPIDERKWRLGKQKSITLLSNLAGVDFNYLGPIDQMVLDKAIQKFLES